MPFNIANMINRKILTLDEFTIQQLRMFPHATGELSNLLRDIGLARSQIAGGLVEAAKERARLQKRLAERSSVHR